MGKSSVKNGVQYFADYADARAVLNRIERRHMGCPDTDNPKDLIPCSDCNGAGVLP